MPELKSTYIGELRIEVTGSYMLGGSPLGQRRLDRLDKGHFRGPKIQAEIVTGGMDLLLGGTDGALRPDVRLILTLDDGETLLILYRGVRHGTPEVMQRIAAPMVGGMVTAPLLSMVVVPAAYLLMRRRDLMK